MKLSLQCAIVGQTGSSFDVEIDDGEKVSKLKKAIKDQKQNDLKNVDADKLQLFLANVPKEIEERSEPVKHEVQVDMTWLSSRSEDVKKLKKGEKTSLIEALTMEHQELQEEDPLEDVLNGIDPPSVRQIHVLVMVSKGDGGTVALVAPSADLTTIHRHPARLKRWAAINEMIRQKNQNGNENTRNQETNKKRKNRDLDCPVAYSNLSWSEVKKAIPSVKKYHLQTEAIPDEIVDLTMNRLADTHKLYGEVYTGKKAKRKMFIAVVLEPVCLLLGDVEILCEEEVNGKNVRVHGQFEFVLKRGKNRISIVEAKRDSIEQGLAQNITGLEALADVEGLDQTFGIVTNYINWVFINDGDEEIQSVDQSLDIKFSMPMRESLKNILGMIYAMLSSNTSSVTVT